MVKLFHIRLGRVKINRKKATEQAKDMIGIYFLLIVAIILLEFYVNFNQTLGQIIIDYILIPLMIGALLSGLIGSQIEVISKNFLKKWGFRFRFFRKINFGISWFTILVFVLVIVIRIYLF